jgi:hypothetical protein
MIRVLTHVATYLLLGPPMCALGAALLFGLYQAAQGQVFDLAGTFTSFAEGRSLGIIYAVGAIPALVTALLSLAWVKDTRGPWGWAIAAIVGGATGGALASLTLPLVLIFPPVLLIIPGLALGGLVGSGISAAAAEALVALVGRGGTGTHAPPRDMRA